jgi:hypothetical protein
VIGFERMDVRKETFQKEPAFLLDINEKTSQKKKLPNPWPTCRK